jgi:hypothetical protein
VFLNYLDLEGRGGKLLRNVDKYSLNSTISHFRRFESLIAKASHTLEKSNVLLLRYEICLNFLLLLLGYKYRNDCRMV